MPSDCGAAAESARDAVTAPARTPPVVARKFRRVGESGSEFFPMKFLDVESTTLEHYTHHIAGRGGEGWGNKVQKPKPPFRAVLVSWVELLKYWPEEADTYEDVENILYRGVLRHNNSKVLEARLRLNTLAFSNLVSLARSKILEFLGPPAWPIDNHPLDRVTFSQA